MQLRASYQIGESPVIYLKNSIMGCLCLHAGSADEGQLGIDVSPLEHTENVVVAAPCFVRELRR